MSKVYDLVILGAGPAGITASIYAARKKLDLLLISQDIGGQAAWSADIENYTGFQFISGPSLVEKFNEHMKAFDVDIKMPEEIRELKKEGDTISLITNRGSYKTRVAIVATGKRPKELDLEEEAKFKNKGLTYCATCDGPVFRGKDVAVIGGGNSALDAALQLVKFCPRVYIINITDSLTGDSIMIDKLNESDNVQILNNSELKEILGDNFVEEIIVNTEGKEERIRVEGVFVEIGLLPNADFINIVKKNEEGEIIVNCNNETDIEGIFAAGDVTTVAQKQIIVASGEGAKASLGAFQYLMRHNFK